MVLTIVLLLETLIKHQQRSDDDDEDEDEDWRRNNAQGVKIFSPP